MSAVRKYLFDTDFDAPAAEAAAPRPVPLARDVREQRAREDQARADGFAAGRTAALDEAASRGAEAVERIAARLTAALDDASALAAQLNEDAAELALAAANLLAGPAAPPRFAAHVRERLAAIIADQVGQPRIVVSVAPEMRPHVQAAADHVVGDALYAGRVDVVADAALAGNDLRIDWKTGALVENRRDRLAALAARIEDYFASPTEGQA